MLFVAVAVLTAGAVAGVGLRWRGARDGKRPLCVSAAEVFCERLESCGVLAPAQQGECVRHHAHACDDDIGWRIRTGALSLDDEAQEECLESLKGAHCNAVAFVYADDEQDIFELTTRCEMEEMLQPRSPPGGACAASSDCTRGYCPSAQTGCRTCRDFAAEGAGCQAGIIECEPGKASCRSADGGSRCLALSASGQTCASGADCADGVCRESGGGRVCGAIADGESCTRHADCSARSYCGGDAGSRRCVARVANGAACRRLEDTNVCAEAEAACVQGRCAVRPFDVPDGELCRSFTDCRPGSYCRWKAAAGDEGACARQWPLNGPCRPFDVQSCRPDMRCINGLCRPLAAEGESCPAPFSCKAELECVPDSADGGFPAGAHCRALGRPGEPCAAHRSCASGLFCSSDGRCAALGPAGAPCRSGDECASGQCVSGSDAATHCGAPCGSAPSPG
jgi:hypothetical protein